jgi:hypothetical protein
MRLSPFLCLFAGLVLQPARAQPDLDILPPNPAYRHNLECATVPAPAFRSMPNSQGDSAICYAYAAADMISQRIGLAVSALDVATTFYFTDPSGLYTANDRRVREFVAEKPGLMDEIVAQRSRVDVSEETNPLRRPYFDKLEGGEEDIAALLLNIKGVCLDQDLPSNDGYYLYTALLEILRRKARAAPDPGICLRSVGATVPKLNDPIADAFNDAWVRYVEERCHRIQSPTPLLPISYRAAMDQREVVERKRAGKDISRRERAHMFAMIDYALDHRRNPTIGYSFYLLEARAPDDPDEFADHSSMVLARKKIDGVCHYLVQDNTGEFCTSLLPNIERRCSAGRIWLNERELNETLYSVTYLR